MSGAAFAAISMHMGPATTVTCSHYEDSSPIVSVYGDGEWWVNFSPSNLTERQAELGDQIAAAFTEYAAEIRRLVAAGVPAYSPPEDAADDDLDHDSPED